MAIIGKQGLVSLIVAVSSTFALACSDSDPHVVYRDNKITLMTPATEGCRIVMDTSGDKVSYYAFPVNGQHKDLTSKSYPADHVHRLNPKAVPIIVDIITGDCQILAQDRNIPYRAK